MPYFGHLARACIVSQSVGYSVLSIAVMLLRFMDKWANVSVRLRMISQLYVPYFEYFFWQNSDIIYYSLGGAFVYV